MPAINIQFSTSLHPLRPYTPTGMNSPGQGLPTFPGQVPIWAPGREPLPPGFSEEDREQLAQMKKWEGYMAMGGESCITKTVLAGTLGARISPLSGASNC